MVYGISVSILVILPIILLEPVYNNDRVSERNVSTALIENFTVHLKETSTLHTARGGVKRAAVSVDGLFLLVMFLTKHKEFLRLPQLWKRQNKVYKNLKTNVFNRMNFLGKSRFFQEIGNRQVFMYLSGHLDKTGRCQHRVQKTSESRS